MAGRLRVHVGDHARRYTVCGYTPDRSGAGPGRVFKGYQGHLQADAHSAYDGLFADGAIKEVGCWMHARREFPEARGSDPARSHLMLARVAGLYEVEDDARGARKHHPEWDDAAWHGSRHGLRSRRSRPLPDAIRAGRDGGRAEALPKGPIGEATGCASNRWDASIRPREAGSLEVDDGASGRALTPVASGRENWLFAASDQGARRRPCRWAWARPARISGATRWPTSATSSTVVCRPGWPRRRGIGRPAEGPPEGGTTGERAATRRRRSSAGAGRPYAGQPGPAARTPGPA